MAAVFAEMRARGIHLKDSHLMTGFNDLNDSLSVWIFYESDSDIAIYGGDGTTEAIRLKFVEALTGYKTQFGFSELPKISFQFDSHENVVKNFKGSYFLRLR